MTDGKKGWKWWRKWGLGFALFLLILLLAFMGCRRRWIRPLPGIRMTLDCPSVSEADLPPESSYRLLLKALGEPPTRVAGMGGGDSAWKEAGAKLRNQPWPELPEDPVKLTDPPSLKLDVGAPGTPWTAEQCRNLLRLAEAHKPKIAMLDAALAAPKPGLLVPADTPDSAHVIDSLHLARWLAISADYRAIRGDIEGSFRDLRRIWNMEALLSRNCSFLNQITVRVGNRTANDSAWYCVTHHDVPAPVLQETARCILDASDSVPSATDQFRIWGQSRAERYAHAPGRLRTDIVLTLLSLKPASYSKPDLPLPVQIGGTTLVWLAGSTRAAVERNMATLDQHAVAIAAAPYSAKTVPAYEALAHAPTSRLGTAKILLTVRDPMGYLYAASQVRTYARLHSDHVADQAQMRGMALFLAAKAYEKDNGHIPDALEQLVPDYLPRVPKDPYDGKPFRYLKRDVPGLPPDAWAVYSIGDDFTDDGGSSIRAQPSSATRAFGSPDAVWPSAPYLVLPTPAKTP